MGHIFVHTDETKVTCGSIKWKIKVLSTASIRFTLFNATIPEDYLCHASSLSLFDGEQAEPHLMLRECGRLTHLVIRTITPVMAIHLQILKRQKAC